MFHDLQSFVQALKSQTFGVFLTDEHCSSNKAHQKKKPPRELLQPKAWSNDLIEAQHD